MNIQSCLPKCHMMDSSLPWNNLNFVYLCLEQFLEKMCYIWNEVKCTLEVELLFKEFFYLKIYQDNIFYILKFIYDISITKQFKNIKKNYFF